MRNEVHDDNPSVYDSVVARRNRRRKQAIAGVASLALLGAGAYAVTAQVAGDKNSAVQQISAGSARQPAPGSGQPAQEQQPDTGATSAPAAAAASEAPTPEPKTTQEQIQAVQGAAFKNQKDRVKRPLAPPAKAVTDDEVTETTIGSHQDAKGSIKVVSARTDLTGQRELSWVAGPGKKVGSSECTQEIRVTPDAPARVRPTMWLCWRTSASKSVYTITVNLKRKPSAKAGVAQIDKTWASLS
ncbi:hypothetical protein [Actinoplanes sp. NPDC051859]|uniref:hypothetical protein n=1 Tax=Actinoplanes sp. NPDC051859 TaxID=3363909 RepID=UPI0037A31195